MKRNMWERNSTELETDKKQKEITAVETGERRKRNLKRIRYLLKIYILGNIFPRKGMSEGDNESVKKHVIGTAGKKN